MRSLKVRDRVVPMLDSDDGNEVGAVPITELVLEAESCREEVGVLSIAGVVVVLECLLVVV